MGEVWKRMVCLPHHTVSLLRAGTACQTHGDRMVPGTEQVLHKYLWDEGMGEVFGYLQ